MVDCAASRPKAMPPMPSASAASIPVSRQRLVVEIAETKSVLLLPARAEMLSVAGAGFKTMIPIPANDYKRLMNFSMLMSACRKIARGVPRSSRS